MKIICCLLLLVFCMSNIDVSMKHVFCAELSHFEMLGDHGILQINRSRWKAEARANQVGQEEWRMAWFSCMID